MNIVEARKIGKKVRRRSWRPHQYVTFDDTNFQPRLEDFIAEDWEEYIDEGQGEKRSVVQNPWVHQAMSRLGR